MGGGREGGLRVRRGDLAAMAAHVAACAPLEACGLLAGAGGESVAVLPVTNRQASPVRFLMEPREQLAAFRVIERNGWEMLAIFHSHPTGPPVPSATDVAEAYYPDAFSLIWCPSGGRWRCRAFTIRAGEVSEVGVEVVEG